MSHRATGADLPAVADLSTLPHWDAEAHTDLPADIYPDANLPHVSDRAPGDGHTDTRTNGDARANGGALAGPHGADSGDA